MSELTQCNYCDLEEMKRRYKGQKLHKVRKGGWIDIYFVPKGDTLDKNKGTKQWHGSMMEISDHCVC